MLVGKGVTFDSGGISLKPSAKMWKMKGDMAGAAATIAALGVAARLNLPLEVISTDAEGRMLLADALADAARFTPAAVVDIATLTGAQAAAVFANNDDLVAKLLAAADASGDRLWRLPLYDDTASGHELRFLASSTT